MRLSARACLPVVLSAGLGLGLASGGALAGSLSGPAGTGTGTGVSPSLPSAGATAAPNPVTVPSTTPSLGEAFGPSSTAQISLAEHLRAVGAVFYGAFWCQHCFRQKLLFGQEAGNRLPYVECAKDEAGAKVCDDAGVTAYPTWVMGGRRLVGVQTLQELATWSNYTGPAGFTSSSSGR